MERPHGLKFAPGSLWVRADGARATVGLTDKGQAELGMVLYMELPEPGDQVRRGEAFAVAETVNEERELPSPLTGKVLEVNRRLESSPLDLHHSPYVMGWIAVLEADDPRELELLLSAPPPETELE